MATTSTELSTLVLNLLTQEQYNTASKNANELYLINNTDNSEVFVATYGATTFGEIATALAANKICICVDNTNSNSVKYGQLILKEDSAYYFESSENLMKISSNDIWTIENINTDEIYLTKIDPNGTGSLSLNRKNDSTIGTNSVALGIDTTASGNYSIAEGKETTASGESAHAEGVSTTASKIGAHAEGYKTNASGNYSHAEGYVTTASGTYSHAEGAYAAASRPYSHAEGYNTKVTSSTTATPLIASTTDAGYYGHVEGYGTVSYGLASHAEGNGTFAKGLASHSEGRSTAASGYASHAEGNNTTASGNYSHAEGGYFTPEEGEDPVYNTASGDCSHVEGASNTASGLVSHAEGGSTTASGSYSHAEGLSTTASGPYSHAEGCETTSLGKYSHTEGRNTKVTTIDTDQPSTSSSADAGHYGHAEGYGTISYGTASHAEGMGTSAKGRCSHAEGSSTTASGYYSHAEGGSTTASGYYSHAEGYSTTASTHYSHAENVNTKATGTASHAEGDSTTASGGTSHAEGSNTIAYGYQSHAEGSNTVAYGESAHAEGAGGSTYIKLTGNANATTYNYTINNSIYAPLIRTGLVILYNNNKVFITDVNNSTITVNQTLSNSSLNNQEVQVLLLSAKGISGAHAEGYGTYAGGDYGSHAEGYHASAIGNYGSHAEGQFTIASGVGSHAEGQVTQASGDASHASGYSTIALDNQFVIGHYNSTSTGAAATSSGTGTGSTTNESLFVIGNGTASAGANAFRVNQYGKAYCKTSYSSSGADYAEYFEWEDLNLYKEDRRGYFVTLDGEKIKIAQPGDYILGVISALPAIIGNGDEDWMNRYVYDEFGSFVYEEYEYETPMLDKQTQEIKMIKQTGIKHKENPNYDPTIIYTPREERPEWDAVGMIGVLTVRDDGTCKVNSYCQVAEGGIATSSENGYRVIKRINDHIVKIIFK